MGIFLKTKTLFILTVVTCLSVTSVCLAAGEDMITEQLNDSLDLSTVFQNESGSQVRLSDVIKDKPVILSLVYYACPGLCNFHLNGLTEGLKKMNMQPGKDYDLIAISFDPKETSGLASAKKQSYLKAYQADSETEKAWHFLVGDEKAVKATAEKVGFRYERDADNINWNHSSAAIFISPEGKISRYLKGSYFTPRELQFAVIEASGGKVGSALDRLTYLFVDYDSVKAQYVYSLKNLSVLAGIFLASISLLMWLALRGNKKLS